MNEIRWSSEMSVGIPEMDGSHAKLFNDLRDLRSTADSEFPERYEAMVARIERDFCEEEELMESVGFPAQRSHVEQHARVLSGLHHALPRVMAGNIALGRHAIDLLPQWLALHIPTMDNALAIAVLASLKSHEQQEKPAAGKPEKARSASHATNPH